MISCTTFLNGLSTKYAPYVFIIRLSHLLCTYSDSYQNRRIVCDLDTQPLVSVNLSHKSWLLPGLVVVLTSRIAFHLSYQWMYTILTWPSTAIWIGYHNNFCHRPDEGKWQRLVIEKWRGKVSLFHFRSNLQRCSVRRHSWFQEKQLLSWCFFGQTKVLALLQLDVSNPPKSLDPKRQCVDLFSLPAIQDSRIKWLSDRDSCHGKVQKKAAGTFMLRADHFLTWTCLHVGQGCTLPILYHRRGTQTYAHFLRVQDMYVLSATSKKVAEKTCCQCIWPYLRSMKLGLQVETHTRVKRLVKVERLWN